MSTQVQVENPIRRIRIHLHVGSDRLAATDDPVFVGLRGPSGREFRLALARGRALRRKGDEHYVFGPKDDADTNVDHPTLNDPTTPVLDADTVEGVYVRKRQEPIPNVRGMGEMDDRLQLESIEVRIESANGERVYRREGPIWLGLTCGLSFDLPAVDEG